MTPDDPRHGTEAGCREHYRYGQSACPPCLEAHRRANIMRQLYPHKRSSLGAQRRIQALQAIGYGRHRIAREIGYSNGGALTYLMRSETMLTSTFDRIREAYERLSMTVPAGRGPERARSWAKRHGYAPPLAWDDIDTDLEPYREPTQWHPKRHTWKREDLLAEWAHLRSFGVAPEQAARQLGVTLEAVDRAEARARGAA